jgi:valyl-tRNA synthetase
VVNLGEDEHGIEEALERFSPYLRRLAGVSHLTIGFGLEKPPASAVDIVGTHEVFVPLAGLIDLDAERARLQKEIEQKEQFLSGVRRKLQNEQFLSKAPEAVVDKERAKEADASAEIEKLKANLAELG